jgi:DNA-binding transcriptional ArsR family regulator
VGLQEEVMPFHGPTNAPVDIKAHCFLSHREARSLRAMKSFVVLLHLFKYSEKSLAQHYTIWCNVDVDQLTDVLTAISHPTRRAILAQLANGPARFLDIAEPYDTALNAVTKHLKMLERAGLIERQKRGREVMISFRAEPLRLVSGWVHEYERFWNERLDQFELHFRDKKKKEKKK